MEHLKNFSRDQGAIEANDLNHWDINFWSERLRESKYDINEGNLDKTSPNAGYVLLMFCHLYEGKDRREFESELIERFGSLVKMPLLKSDRSPLPGPVKSILEEGINLYKLHTNRHGRSEPSKGSYSEDWDKWEKRLREVLSGNAEFLNSIQVPFDCAVEQVLKQLRSVAKG